VAMPASGAAMEAETQPGGLRVYAFLFAWYAQHPNDTDYAALSR
jgi:hypothetical protein